MHRDQKYERLWKNASPLIKKAILNKQNRASKQELDELIYNDSSRSNLIMIYGIIQRMEEDKNEVLRWLEGPWDEEKALKTGD
jgi:HSP90 family molecular chaperone